MLLSRVNFSQLQEMMFEPVSSVVPTAAIDAAPLTQQRWLADGGPVLPLQATLWPVQLQEPFIISLKMNSHDDSAQDKLSSVSHTFELSGILILWMLQ